MIINKINIEGLCTEEELLKISSKNSIIINKSINIKVTRGYGIKDILEISMSPNILSFKTLNLMDKSIGTITINTDFNILSVENNTTNSLIVVDEKLFFNYSFDTSSNAKSLDNYFIKIIDCYFKVEDNNTIIGTLTYLIKEQDQNIKNSDNTVSEVREYRLIDICQEFA